jgi:hypothetical protein
MGHFALLDPDPKHWSLHDKNHISVAIIKSIVQSYTVHLMIFVLDSVSVKYLAAASCHLRTVRFRYRYVPVSHCSTLPLPDIWPLNIMNLSITN